jgi:hypothetical protein
MPRLNGQVKKSIAIIIEAFGDSPAVSNVATVASSPASTAASSG